MSGDRLAAFRDQFELHRLHTPTHANGQQGQESSQPATSSAPHVNGTSNAMTEFSAQVESIQTMISEFEENSTAISRLHARSLNVTSEQESTTNASELAELTRSTQRLINDISKQIKALKSPVDGLGKSDREIRKNRITLVHGNFVSAMERYQQTERECRQRNKNRMRRQYEIVKPDATAEEISAAVDDTSDQNVFLQAIATSNRYGEAKGVFLSEQERRKDIQRIEDTLAELAGLFNELALMVESQNEKLDNINVVAAGVAKDTEAANTQVKTAVKHARSARRKRWICFWLTIVIILAAVGIGVGVYFSQHPPSSNSSSSSPTATATVTVSAVVSPSATTTA